MKTLKALKVKKECLSVISTPEGFEVWGHDQSLWKPNATKQDTWCKIATIYHGARFEYHGACGYYGKKRNAQFWKMLAAICEYWGSNDVWE